MVSYLRSLVQFSPAAGRAGRCRQTSLCVGSTPRVPATLGLPRTGVSLLSPSTLLRLPAALYGAGPVLSAVPVFGSSTKAWIRLCCVLCLPRPERFRQPEARAPSPRVRRAFSLRSPSVFRRLGACGLLLFRGVGLQTRPSRRRILRNSLDRNRGPVCSVGGGGFSRAEFAPFSSPCLLPPAGMGRLFSGVSQSLCFANRRRCVPAGQFFLALPQFKRAPSDCSQGLRASPYPKQCRPLLSVSPPLAGGRCGHLGYFSAGSCF